MLSRNNQETAPNFLPLEWQQKIETLLFEIYKAQCQKDSSGFQVHGITYPNEVFLSVSYVNLKSPTSTPYTLLVSCDLDDKTDPLKTMDNLVDSVGMLLDHFFQSDEREIETIWNEIEFQKKKVYFRTTRENISLTIEANRILEEND